MKTLAAGICFAWITLCSALNASYTNTSTTASLTLPLANLILQGLGGSTTEFSSSHTVTTAESSSTSTATSVGTSTTHTTPAHIEQNSTTALAQALGTSSRAHPATSSPTAAERNNTTVLAQSLNIASPASSSNTFSQSQQNSTTGPSNAHTTASPGQSSSVCAADYDGFFSLDAEPMTSVKTRQISARASALTITLHGGRLETSQNLTGYFTTAGAFSFDKAPPSDAAHLSDWCLTNENVLHAAEQAIFYLSGGEIYDHRISDTDTSLVLRAVPVAVDPASSTKIASTGFAGNSSATIMTSASGIVGTAPSATATMSPNSTSGNTNSSDPLSQCAAKAHAWSMASSAWFTSVGSAEISYSLSYSSYSTPSSIIYPNVPAYTTLCDGHARVSGPIVTEYATETLTQTITQMPNYTVSQFPNCQLNQAQCSAFWSTYSSCSSSSDSSVGAGLPVTTGLCAEFLGSPLCSSNAPATTASQFGFCAIQVEGVRLQYWPVSAAGGNLCNSSGTTITPTGPPPVATLGTLTITSPMIAIEIDSLSLDAQGLSQYANVTQTLYKATITMPEDQLSSGVPAPHIVLNGSPFQYQNLNPGQVPWSAWTQQGDWVQECNGYSLTRTDIPKYCNTVFVDNYSPVLAPMSQVAQLVPGWSGCLPLFGLWDPPTALTAVASMAGPTTALAGSSPTLSSAPQTSAPAPQSTVAAPTPTSTPSAAQQTQSPIQASPEPDQTGGNDPAPVSNPGNTGNGNTQISGASSPANNQPAPSPSQVSKGGGDPAPSQNAGSGGGALTQSGSGVSSASKNGGNGGGDSGQSNAGGGGGSMVGSNPPISSGNGGNVGGGGGSPSNGGDTAQQTGSNAPSGSNSGGSSENGGSASGASGQDSNPFPSIVPVQSSGENPASGSGLSASGQQNPDSGADNQGTPSDPAASNGAGVPSIVPVPGPGTGSNSGVSSNNQPQPVLSSDPSGGGSVTLVGESTLQPGQAPVVAGGSTFSALPGGSGVQVIANGQTSTVAPAPAANTIPAAGGTGSNPFVPQISQGVTVVGGQTLAVGSTPAIVGGTTFTALPNGGGVAAIANGKTSTMQPAVAGNGGASPYVTMIAGQTLAAGSAPVIVSGTTFSALPNNGGVAVFANGRTSTVQPVVESGGSPSVTLVAGQTLAAGSAPVTLSGTTFSALPNNGGIAVIANGHTSTVQPILGGSGAGPDPNGASVTLVAGQTLAAGSTAVLVGGTTFTALPNNGGVEIIAGGHTSTIQQPAAGSGVQAVGVGPSVVAAADANDGLQGSLATVVQLPPQASAITLSDGSVITALPLAPHASTTVVQGPDGPMTVSVGANGLVISGQTLHPGQPARTIGQDVFSVDAAGDLIAEEDDTIMTGSASGIMLVDGTTIQAGMSPKTIDGIAYSLNQNGQLLQIVGDRTMTLAPAPSGAMIIDGTTITKGSAPVTIDGQIYSLNAQCQLIDHHTDIIASGLGASSWVLNGVTLTAGGAAQSIGGLMYMINADGQLVQVTTGSRGPLGEAEIAAMLANMAGSAGGAEKDGQTASQTSKSAAAGTATAGPLPGGTQSPKAAATTSVKGAALALKPGGGLVCALVAFLAFALFV